MGKKKLPFASQTIAREPFNADASVSDKADVSRLTVPKKLAKAQEYNDDVQEIVKSKLVHFNYMIHEFKDLSPDPIDWVVSEYYPNAKDENGNIAPAFVDRPKNKRQQDLCIYKKSEIMKAKKRRYVVVLPEKDISVLAQELEGSI